MNYEKKCCKKCGLCDWFWITETKKQYYCKWKLQIERSKSYGKEENAFVKPHDNACDKFDSYEL